jgi:hypothetical protein
MRICLDVTQVSDDALPLLVANASALLSGDAGLSKAIIDICSDPSQLAALPASSAIEALRAEVAELDAQLEHARRQSAELGLLLQLEQERQWLQHLKERRTVLLRQLSEETEP